CLPPHVLARDLSVVEGDAALADDLHRLVPLPGDEHGVPVSREVDGPADGLGAILDDEVAALVIAERSAASGASPLLDGREDACRRLAARVVGGDHHDVCASCRDLAHEGPLAGVAIAPAAEDDEQTSRREGTERLDGDAE